MSDLVEKVEALLESLADSRVSVASKDKILISLRQVLAEVGPRQAKVIRLCAIPRWFDASVLAVLREQDDDNERILEMLQRYSFVQRISTGVYTYSDQVRSALLREWREQHNDEMRPVLLRLANYFDERANMALDSMYAFSKDSPADFRDRWNHEALYCRLIIDWQSYMANLNALFDQAEAANDIVEAEALLHVTNDAVIVTSDAVVDQKIELSLDSLWKRLDKLVQPVDSIESRATGEVTKQSNKWSYDAFISYHPADEQWVWAWLIPRLEADKVRVDTERENFEIGIPRLIQMERAVTVSHHTLLVLSPDWVKDDWKQFDNLLTQQEDPIGLRQRILPLLHRACVLPPRLAALTLADFTRSDIETQYRKLLDTLRGQRNLIDLDDLGAPTLPPPPPIAPANPQQVALGFRYNPFAFPMAEEMPQAILEETFILHDGFAEQIMSLERSAVLLAPMGGGKTASRRLVEAHLERCYIRALTGDISGPTTAALAVIYNDFEALVEYLPHIHLRHHIVPLLVSIAEAIYNHIVIHPDLLMRHDRMTRDWWWSFFDIYLSGEHPSIRLVEHRHLHADYRERETIHTSIFRLGSSLRAILTTLLHHLRDLEIERIFILVDEMDGDPGIQARSSLMAVAKPLLNSPSLLSLSGVVWKFFLPDVLEQAVTSSLGHSTGRLPLVSITWDGHHSTQPALELIQLLCQRLIWASEGKISDIDGLASQELARTVKIEQELVAMALRHRRLGPPRALLDLGSQLLETMAGPQISLKEWEEFKKLVHPILPDDSARRR